MQMTSIAEAIATLRQTYTKPMTQMEIIRKNLIEQAGAVGQPGMPAILSNEQRSVFAGKLDQLEGFLASEDGQDAIELLMTAFDEYTSQPVVEPAPEVEEEVEDNPRPHKV